MSIKSLPLLIFLSLSFSLFSQNRNLRWFKGNVHVHTSRSDGKSLPDSVVSWYKQKNYNFLVITDHNMITSPDKLNVVYGNRDSFFVMHGEEISDFINNRKVHIGALGIKRPIEPTGGTSVASLVDSHVNSITQQAGLAILNHPNGVYNKVITAAD